MVLAGISLYYVALVVIPISRTLRTSFYEAFFVKENFVGLANYAELVGDPVVRKAALVTLQYVAFTVPVQMAVGFLLASAVFYGFSSQRMRILLSACYYFPAVVPIAATAAIWKYILWPKSEGPVNGLLSLFGIPVVAWLTDPDTVLLALALVGWIGGSAFAMLLFLSGLTSIPDELYDAARIDGASFIRQVRHIVLPLLMPTTAFLSVISILHSVMVFVPVLVMTGGLTVHEPKGGPLYAAHTIVWEIYKVAYLDFREGYSAAIGMTFMFAMALISYFQVRMMRRQFAAYSQ